MARSRRDDHDNEPTLEAWWYEPEDVRDEQVRKARTRDVAAAGAGRVGRDHRPQPTLFDVGGGSVGTGDDTDPAAAGARRSRGDLLHQDRPDRERGTAGRGDRPGRPADPSAGAAGP